jgi:hypothetical protein
MRPKAITRRKAEVNTSVCIEKLESLSDMNLNCLKLVPIKKNRPNTFPYSSKVLGGS